MCVGRMGVEEAGSGVISGDSTHQLERMELWINWIPPGPLDASGPVPPGGERAAIVLNPLLLWWMFPLRQIQLFVQRHEGCPRIAEVQA